MISRTAEEGTIGTIDSLSSKASILVKRLLEELVPKTAPFDTIRQPSNVTNPSQVTV